VFDPTTGRFSAGPSLHVGRLGHTATLMPDGRVLMAGGWTAASADRASTEWYEPASRRFDRGAAMRLGRAGHTATLLRDGRVLIVGGVDGRETPLSSAELFDPRTNRFAPAGSLHQARFKLPMALVKATDGRVFVLGGAETAEVFDPATGRFDEVRGSIGTAQFYGTAALLPGGQMLVAGGYAEGRDGLPGRPTSSLPDRRQAGAMSFSEGK